MRLSEAVQGLVIVIEDIETTPVVEDRHVIDMTHESQPETGKGPPKLIMIAINVGIAIEIEM